MTGTVDEHRHLQVDGSLPVSGPMRVRILVLYLLSDEWDETEWLWAATRNPAFAFDDLSCSRVRTVKQD
jgi:hypothetical protein